MEHVKTKGWRKKTSAGQARGQSVVEFTLLLPLLIILIGGLTDLGMAVVVAIGLQNAVHEGAREAANALNLSANDSRVTNAVIPKIPAITLFSNIAVTNTAPSSANCDAEVTVTASGNFNYTILRYIGFTSTQISRSTTMRYSDRPLCTT